MRMAWGNTGTSPKLASLRYVGCNSTARAIVIPGVATLERLGQNESITQAPRLDLRPGVPTVSHAQPT